jgi:MerR family transcriptional regulator/heat shock protein HspR
MREERKQHRTILTGTISGRATDSHRPVYHISVVAEIVETHPQTLRMYERMGLISPQRTRNNVRLYSEADEDLGVNLAGVEVVFKLLDEIERMRLEAEEQLKSANDKPEKPESTTRFNSPHDGRRYNA